MQWRPLLIYTFILPKPSLIFLPSCGLISYLEYTFPFSVLWYLARPVHTHTLLEHYLRSHTMNILLHSRQSFPPSTHLPTIFTSTGILLIAHETLINNLETPHTQTITAIQTLRDRIVTGGKEGKVVLYQWEGNQNCALYVMKQSIKDSIKPLRWLEQRRSHLSQDMNSRASNGNTIYWMNEMARHRGCSHVWIHLVSILMLTFAYNDRRYRKRRPR